MLNKNIKAFTLAELMVTLALTSILITFVYTGYGYIQKLFIKSKDQSYFITQLCELNKRLSRLSNLKGEITVENKTKFSFKADSLYYFVDFTKNNILITTGNVTDTFHLETESLNTEFETFANPQWKEKLVNKIEFEVLFEKEKFHLILNKQYDAYSKLILETQINK